ncbi:MFS transporter [Nocardioides currus]|uniref:MFS transporter n=1 Tax=Nocardioides currus TaxID=2133958 RepID=A0A2R7YSB0_9ACTN|nr:MFS transporter [Nocardioides currus]PUA79272.1 MFS transporter [Nocardioides currus]
MTSGTYDGERSAHFVRFWWGEAVSGMGTAITTLALQTLVVVTLQGGPSEVGWLNTARWLPYLVLGLVVGALVDRVRRRPVMIVTDLVRAGLLGLVPLAWVLDVLSLPMLLGVVLAFGTASVVNDAASFSIVPRLVPRAGLQRAHARLDQAAAVAQTGGPALAGALIRVVGAPLAVLVDAATYLFSAAMVASLPRTSEPDAAPRSQRGLRQLGREIREGTRWAYGRSGLRPMALSTHVWFAGQAVLGVLIAPYALLELDLSPFALGLALAVAGVGALVGASTSSWVGRRLGSVGAITCSYAVSTGSVLVLLAAGWVPAGWAAAVLLAAGQLCHGWAMGNSNSHEMSYRQAATPDELQARTNTTLRSLNRAVVVVVSPVVGVLADAVGYGAVLAGGAVLFAVSALMVGTLVPSTPGSGST